MVTISRYELLGGRRVMVTGGGGFLGGALVHNLEERGAPDIFVPRARDYDLREHGAIIGAPAKSDGQPRRALDTTRAREAFGFQARTSFTDGLRRAIEDYLAARVAVS